MSDTALPYIIRFDTAANRAAFTPTPGVAEQLYIWLDSDSQPDSFYWDGAAWQAFATGAVVGGVTQLTGDVTAGPGSGSQVATIPPDTVTLAKIANAAANSVLVGAGAAGIGINYTEITLGSGLSMTGTVLDATAGAGGITQLTGDVTAGPGSGSQAATIPADTVTFAKMQNIASGVVLGKGTASSGDVEELTPANGIETTTTPGIRQTVAARTRNIAFIVSGGGSVITIGDKGNFSFPVAGTLTGWRLLANAAGNLDFDVTLDPYASYPPTTSILTPSLSGVDQNEATGLSQAVAAGDVFGIEITGTPTVIVRCTIEFTIVVTG